MKTRILLVLVLLGVAAYAQTQYQNAYVSITGNSIAHFQATFPMQEFPAVPASNVYIWGADSATCAYFLQANPTGTPILLYYVPARTTVAVLINSTNDIRTGVPVAEHMQCMEQTISILLARSPNLKIVVANTPPWTQWDPCSGTNRDYSIVQAVEAYNTAYADPATGLRAQFPNNVRVADVFTPSAYPSGWGIPADLAGPCGIHPGQEFQWSASWQHFASAYELLVTTAINGLW